MDEMPPKVRTFGGAYENTSYTVCIFTQTAHNSQTIFKIIIFYNSMRVNSLLLSKVIFVAMHTKPIAFLYILSTAENS